MFSKGVGSIILNSNEAEMLEIFEVLSKFSLFMVKSVVETGE